MFIYCYQYEAIVSLRTYPAHDRAVDDRDAVTYSKSFKTKASSVLGDLRSYSFATVAVSAYPMGKGSLFKLKFEQIMLVLIFVYNYSNIYKSIVVVSNYSKSPVRMNKLLEKPDLDGTVGINNL